MTEIIALKSHRTSGKVVISDSKGETTISNDIEELLSSLVFPYPDAIKVVWDMEDFLKPITKLLPQEVVAKLNKGERVEYGEFKLFWGFGKGSMLGVDWHITENIKGNFYNNDSFEDAIFQLKTFYPNELEPKTLGDIQSKGQFLLDTLRGMGYNPTKLTSPASVFEECVLEPMDLYRLCDMPDNAIEFAEWAANLAREWRSCYKIGYFHEAHDYDLGSAYGSVLSKVPDFHHAKYVKVDYLKRSGGIPQGTYWGILKGVLDITADISPIVSADGKCYKGKRPEMITTTDLACIKRWNLGTFAPESAWFVSFDKLDFIFDAPMRKLYGLRNTDNKLQVAIAKNQAASAWGKMSQRFENRVGNLYFPPIPSMITSKVRCNVCDFIYSHQLQSDLLSVTVDGLLATKYLSDVPTTKAFGEWRYNGSSEALVMSSAFQWCLDKKPASVDVKQMVEAIKKHPQSTAWNGVALRFLDHDRQFMELPRHGNDLLNNVYTSQPFEIKVEK